MPDLPQVDALVAMRKIHVALSEAGYPDAIVSYEPELRDIAVAMQPEGWTQDDVTRASQAVWQAYALLAADDGRHHPDFEEWWEWTLHATENPWWAVDFVITDQTPDDAEILIDVPGGGRVALTAEQLRAFLDFLSLH